jgi:hypothetical protein
VQVTVPPPRRDTARRRRARAALVDVLWRADGTRRLPRDAELVRALEACDARDVWWVCEASSAGPVYLLPTREWVSALAKWLDSVKARTVLEVAAGDGFLSSCLRRARPSLRVVATDNHAWHKPEARQSVDDKRAYRGVAFAGITHDRDGAVLRMSAASAVEKFRPDVVLVSWPPPGPLVERVLRGPCKLVVEIGADGDVCGDSARTWRWRKEFLDDTPLAQRALCRLDARPTGAAARQTRVTLYYGKRHRLHGRE